MKTGTQKPVLSQNININVDVATRVVEVRYRPNLAIREETVTLPFHLLKLIVGQIVSQEGQQEGGGVARVQEGIKTPEGSARKM